MPGLLHSGFEWWGWGVFTQTHAQLSTKCRSVKCDVDWRVSNDNVMCGGPFETRAAVSVSARATWPAVPAEKHLCLTWETSRTRSFSIKKSFGGSVNIRKWCQMSSDILPISNITLWKYSPRGKSPVLKKYAVKMVFYYYIWCFYCRINVNVTVYCCGCLRLRWFYYHSNRWVAESTRSDQMLWDYHRFASLLSRFQLYVFFSLPKRGFK